MELFGITYTNKKMDPGAVLKHNKKEYRNRLFKNLPMVSAAQITCLLCSNDPVKLLLLV